MMKEIHNRRRHFRFNVEKGSISLKKSRSKEELGVLLNLSYGGLAYHYVPHMVRPDNEFQFDLFLDDNSPPLLNSIPTEIIYDFDASEVFLVDSDSYRICGVKFTHMGEKQKYQIEHCIKKHTLIKHYIN